MGIKGKPGASLRVWKDYFPNANIIGVDIDENILFLKTEFKHINVTKPITHLFLNLYQMQI